jgi:hypothetical protein
MKSFPALICFGMVVTATSLASAQGYGAAIGGGAAPRGGIDNIGNQGQLVIGVDRVMGLNFITDTTEDEEETIDPVTGNTTTAKFKTTEKYTTIGLAGTFPTTILQLPRLGIDYFVTDGLSLGASLMYLRVSGEQEQEVTIGGETETDSEDLEPVNYLLFHPRIGYSVIIDETFAFWPRAGITWAQTSSTQTTQTVDPITGNLIDVDVDRSETLVELTLEANFVISPIEHFAFLVGPFLDLGLSGEEKSEVDLPGAEEQKNDRTVTAYGLQVGVAGYF